MKNRTPVRLLVALVAAMVMGSACIELSRVSQPSASADIIKTLSTGLWSSNGTINPDACGDFKWAISEINDTSAKGTFSASCAGGISLAGSAEGTLNGSVLNWKAAGLAKTPIGDCSFTVNGTAQLEGAYVRVNYTANTCAGTFSGSELLKK